MAPGRQHGEHLGVSGDPLRNAGGAGGTILVQRGAEGGPDVRGFPGVDSSDSEAISAVRDQLAGLPPSHVHLVLNATCEMSVLQAQWQAFAPLEPEDLIFTHLDEERKRIKLWNFVFGTNCCIRFLSAGQKIPGEFQRAVPELLFPVENPR